MTIKILPGFFNTNRVIIWGLLIEEYGLEIEYIQGKKNIVEEKLSRLRNNGNQKTTHKSNYKM